MKTLPTARLAGIILIGCLLLAGGAVSAAGIQVYMGDIVTLQGYSTGSPTVYLFLTGPESSGKWRCTRQYQRPCR